MGDTYAKPSISFSTRVDLDTDKRRKRLQRKYGLTGPELVRRALEALEAALVGERGASPAS
jgi:hypothetical protein